MSTSIPVPAGVAKSVNRSLGGAPFGIRETEGRPLGHLEIRVAQVASPAAFWTFEGWDGVRLNHFDIFGLDSNPRKTFWGRNLIRLRHFEVFGPESNPLRTF